MRNEHHISNGCELSDKIFRMRNYSQSFPSTKCLTCLQNVVKGKTWKYHNEEEGHKGQNLNIVWICSLKFIILSFVNL